MKTAIVTLSLFFCGDALAGDLLVRGLSCKLKSDELLGLMPALAKADPHFAAPTKRYSLPSFDVYTLDRPVEALGHKSATIAVQPGRIVLMLDGVSLAALEKELHLEKVQFSPSSRAIDDVRSIVGYELSVLPGKVLVGCEYATADASRWVKD